MDGAISYNVMMQFWLLVASIIAGLLVMLVYDAFRAIRRIGALKRRQVQRQMMQRWKDVMDAKQKYVGPKESCGMRIWVHMEDLIFWFLYLIITYWVIYTYNSGVFSLYVIFGELLGVWVYHKLFHNWIRCLYTCILWQIYTIIMWICHFLLLLFCGICAKSIKVLKLLMKCLKMISINN